MNKEEQYLLFALSAPMEILNQGCKPAHDSPKMYTGIKEFELSSSWGINNRDDLQLLSFHRISFYTTPYNFAPLIVKPNGRGNIVFILYLDS